MSRATTNENFTTARRFYFDNLQISIAPLKLSVLTASRLPAELKAIKHQISLPFIQFERAPVSIQMYVKRHLFETANFVLDDIVKVSECQIEKKIEIYK